MFSVIIPYYKKRKFIERCLDSVIAQTITNFEIILVDDGSQDDIAELIAQKYLNSVKLIQQSNHGVSIARNEGIKNSTRDYIAFLDADDYWCPNYLEYNEKVILSNSEVKIIGSHYSCEISKLNRNKQLSYREVVDYFKKQAIINTLFLTSATIVSRSFFLRNDGFNSNLKRGEDIDVWFRVMLSPGLAFYIENTMVYYSNEDECQITSSLGKADETLVGICNLYYEKILKKERNSDFAKFLSKYVYFNLFPYFFSSDNRKQSNENLQLNSHFYLFLHLPYLLPLSLGRRLVQGRRGKLIFRLYLKFLLRNVYL